MEKLRKKELAEKPSAIKIKRLRTERDMTQKEFSEWLQIPLQTIKQWELGLRSAPQWLLKLIEYRCKKATQGEQLEIEEIKDCCKNCKNANIISENLIECCIYGLRNTNSICQSGMYVFQQNKANKATQSEQINIQDLIPTKNKIYYFCYNIDDKGKTGKFRGESIDSVKKWIKNAKGKEKWIEVHEVIKTYYEEDFTNF